MSKAYGMGVYTNTYWYYAQGIDTTGYCTGKDEKVQIMKRTEDSATLEKKDSAKDTDYYCSFMFFQARRSHPSHLPHPRRERGFFFRQYTTTTARKMK